MVRSAVFTTTLCLVLAVAARGTTAEPDLVPSPLLQSALDQGSVRVIVRLAGPGAASEAARPHGIAAAQSAVRGVLQATSHRVVREYRTIPYMAIDASPAALQALDAMRGVVAGVHEDLVLEPALDQSVPLIRAPEAWTAGFDGDGMVVAILDTGVERSDHGFLGGSVVDEACFSSGGDCPNHADTQLGTGAAGPCRFTPNVQFSGIFNPCDHGTHVAGIAVGRGGFAGRIGVAPRSPVIAVQVFSNSHDASSSPVAFTSDIVAGLEYVLSRSQAGDGSFTLGAVNMSLGTKKTFASPADCDVSDGGATKMVIDTLRAAGVVTVVAAGNAAARSQIAFPACISSAVPVVSTGDGGGEFPRPIRDRVSSFSNIASVAKFPALLAAPGQWITSYVPFEDGAAGRLPRDGTGFATLGGTSMAAPHVAGAFAILKQKEPDADVATLLHALQSTGAPITDVRAGVPGGGALPRRIDVLAALESLAPDPTVIAARVTSGPTLPGGNASVTVTLKNVGGKPATDFVVRFTGSQAGWNEMPIGPDLPVALLASHATKTFTHVLHIAPTMPVNLYWVRVTAGPADPTDDPNLGNNSVFATGFVIVTFPDLSVPSVKIAPAAGGPGRSITVTHTLRNVAGLTPSAAPPSRSAIYLGTTSGFGSVIGGALGTVAMPGVVPDATSSAVSTTVPVPPGLPVGRYFVFVRANDDAAFVEGSTANNVGVAPAPLLVGSDLIVASARTAASAMPGTSVGVTYAVRNQGATPSAPAHVGFVLVPVNDAGTPTGAGVALPPAPVLPPLAAGASTPATTIPVPIPPDAAPGAYRIRVVADAAHEVTDADETNDGLLTAGVLSIVKPDLTVASVSFAPATSRANGTITVTHAVRNIAIAPASAGASHSRLYLASPNTDIAIPVADLGLVAVPPVRALGAATATKPVTIPPGVAPGVYYVVARADGTNEVVESNEHNNLGASAARILIGPDLTVTAATTVAAAKAGANVSVTYTLGNKSGDAASGFDIGFTLVPVVPGGGEITIGPRRTGVSLKAGAALASRSTVTIPAGTAPGVYRIRVIADPGNAVIEAEEANNDRHTGTITVSSN